MFGFYSVIFTIAPPQDRPFAVFSGERSGVERSERAPTKAAGHEAALFDGRRRKVAEEGKRTAAPGPKSRGRDKGAGKAGKKRPRS